MMSGIDNDEALQGLQKFCHSLLVDNAIAYDEDIDRIQQTTAPAVNMMSEDVELRDLDDALADLLCQQRQEQQDEPPATGCHNCDDRRPKNDTLCYHCLQLPRCNCCHRHIPHHCFKSDTNICETCDKKQRTYHRAVNNIITELDILVTADDTSYDDFFDRVADELETTVREQQHIHGSIKIFVRTDAAFIRESEEHTVRTSARFVTHPIVLNRDDVFDRHALLSELNAAVDNWNGRGSGFVLTHIKCFTLCVGKNRPLSGTTYVPTPEHLVRKHCLVNVRSDDDRCFIWSVLAALYPQRYHRNRVTQYHTHLSELNIDGLTFPMRVKDIHHFEQQNRDISVNCIYYDPDEKDFTICYMSPERSRPRHVNLLLLGDEEKPHFVCITNMSRLVAGRTKREHATHVCNSCLTPFSSRRVLDNHMEQCLKHHPQQVQYPSETDKTLKFDSVNKQFRLPFFLVADMATFLVPNIDNDDDDDDVTGLRELDTHRVSGFACHRVTDMEQHRTPPTVYSGENPIDVFYEHVIAESRAIAKILGADLPMKPLTSDQQAAYDAADVCGNCGCAFEQSNWKTHHHDHATGDYLFPCCNNCNLQLKSTRKRRRHDNDYEYDFFLPIVFHNLKGYDAHFVLHHFKKHYGERLSSSKKRDGRSCDDINIIPLNSEKYLMFEIGNLRFLDSYQFLATSLDKLVSLLARDGKAKFRHTTTYLGDSDLLYAKGVYPYSYMTDRSRFTETQLPPIEAFYDRLKDEPLSESEYQRAQDIWNHFDIPNLQKYHDHYLLLDVLLLSDVFENFRDAIYQKHNLDCLHFVTLPSLAWAMALKYTDIELELICDPGIYLMIENSIRGGITTISRRHAEANNPYLDDYDGGEPTSYITYLDANSLYATAQSQPLPVGDFRFLNEAEVEVFDLNSVAPDASTGYIVEFDLSYPDSLHDRHADYPMAAEHMTPTFDMLSDHAKSFIESGTHWIPSKKLIPNLYDKTNYVTHYRNLQLYVRHGLKITKIHRILSFSQRAWLQPWIQHCNDQRREATSEFESDLAKLLANATFGKCIESVRKRQNIRLISDPPKLRRAIAKPSFRESAIINDDLVMVKTARQKILLNKPIIVGFAILEVSKYLMYAFYYDYLKPRYDNRCTLLFTDTDSFCCHVHTDDIYRDMMEDQHLFDTSIFEADHPAYSQINHRTLGKFKSETGSVPPKEFVGLRAKMYSLHVPANQNKSQKKVKGILKHYVKKQLKHQDFLDVLHQTTKFPPCTQRMFRSQNHVVNTVEIKKSCLSAFDDKRYVDDDGIRTLPYGHYSLRKSPAVDEL